MLDVVRKAESSSPDRERPSIRTVLLVGSHPESLLNFRGPLIQDMIASGISVVVTAPDIDPVVRAGLAKIGARIFDIPLSRASTSILANLRYMRALRALMRETSPDLVLTYTIKPNIWGSIAAGRMGIRSASMVTGLGLAVAGGIGLKQAMIGKITRWLYARATRSNQQVVFQNPDDRDAFISMGCLEDPSKACLVNGSGVDTTYFSPTPLPGTPTFLMVSRLLASKGVLEYSAAAKLVKRIHPEARFLLVGFLDEVSDSVSEEQLQGCISDGVEFLGKLDDVRPAIARASCYVLPSYYPEGTPRSVLEAMSMGRPIITTDMPGCRETTRDGVNGYLVEARKVDPIVNAMCRIIEDPVLTIRMGAESRGVAEEKYDVRKVNKALLQHLQVIS